MYLKKKQTLIQKFSPKEILKISYKDLTQTEINQILKDSGGPEVLDVSPATPMIDSVGGRNKITRTQAFLRSAAIPGWGQIYQNRKIPSTAYFYFLGVLGLLHTKAKRHKQKKGLQLQNAKLSICTLF